MTPPWQNTDPIQPETADLRDYVWPIWRHKLLILVLVAVATVGTYVYYDRQPRVYQSATTIFVGDANSLSEFGLTASQDRVLANQARLLQTSQVATRVAKQIGFRGDPRALLGGVDVTPTKGSDFVRVNGTAGNPQIAAALANGFAKAFIDVRSSDARKGIEKTLDSLQKRYDTASGPGSSALKRSLVARINQLELQASTPTGEARQIDTALPAGAPTQPKPKRSALFAFALSLLLGIIAAFGLERIDRRIKSSDEAGRIYGLPVIATVRDERDIAPRRDGRVGVAEGVHESFRSLRSNLDLTYGSQAARTILVTSAVASEGKSTILRNLALVYAEAGQRVVVIEADVRRPTLSALFAVTPTSGLTDVLMGVKTLGDVLQEVAIQPTQRPVRSEAPAPAPESGGGLAVLATNGHGVEDEPAGRVDLIASGSRPADPPAMFSAPSLQGLIKQVSTHYDVVLIDSPPLLAVSDAVPLMPLVDGILLVARIGTSTVDAAERCLALLKRVPGARPLGIVVNGVDEGVGGLYGGY